MAKRCQSLIPVWLWPGLIAAGLLLSIALMTFGVLWLHAPQQHDDSLWQDSYLWYVVRFTFLQATLSVLVSVVPAIGLAGALYRRRFPGRQLLLRLCSMTLILPVLVALFGILTVYGKQGWLATLFDWLGFSYTFSPYGLDGILLAHAFFNLPLASRLLLQALETIPAEQRKLAAQLGMSRYQQFRWVEWPALRRQLPSCISLIFMLCFASFATVLVLGGGPQATTIELAIYQALSYEYNLEQAALLALLQLICCLGLMILSQRFNHQLPSGSSNEQHWQDPADNLWQRICDSALIVAAMLLVLPPLFAVLLDGTNQAMLSVLQQPALWQALSTSLHIALLAGTLCVMLTMMLLWSSRELKLRQHVNWGYSLELTGMIILAMPGIVLATGCFLLLNNTIGIPQSPYLPVVLINALMAIPYALKILDNPMRDLAERHNRLCQSLGITGWRRLWWVELAALKQPLSQAFAFACLLSLGDFGVVALFGSEQFLTLPFYLYQQIAAYRSNDGAVTALLMLLLCFLLFTLIERLPNRHADA
ncbi:thiamine/thiamine pyrophosphate ABC transporter permease ThiP [Serratia microhaemolytica]|uniref:thiamine/thiamine pyrophosphate ABC transporter permease ThiP n=1 Tax=Serratia microhaemolytica TaxID=2675110 RepID=UPI000FDEF343|nr:thiamine/thiamine pyrophosphate ABC transporter permease ThiP [Serratia microhaemolytica]